MSRSGVEPDFLVHADGDVVAVAVRDLRPGPVRGTVLASGSGVEAVVGEPVPLGHKFALADVAEGDDVVEYGVRVAVASKVIARGSHVHTQNVRSARWQTSVAS